MTLETLWWFLAGCVVGATVVLTVVAYQIIHKVSER
jgi:hypothetical protein